MGKGCEGAENKAKESMTIVFASPYLQCQPFNTSACVSALVAFAWQVCIVCVYVVQEKEEGGVSSLLSTSYSILLSAAAGRDAHFLCDVVSDVAHGTHCNQTLCMPGSVSCVCQKCVVWDLENYMVGGGSHGLCASAKQRAWRGGRCHCCCYP